MVKPTKAKLQPAEFRPKGDRRIVRTRNALGDALVTLMKEKNFDDITVQDVLDRAGVGRATFYVHFSGKDDLFMTDVEQAMEWFSSALERQGAGGKRLLPVAEFFGHIRDVRQFYAALVKSGKIHDVQELGKGLFARSIEQRLKAADLKMEPAQRSAHAYVLAGSVFSLLDWWIDKGMKSAPQEMDELFHRMAWSGLAER
jgi:AcrR family transcriptional regulator